MKAIQITVLVLMLPLAIVLPVESRRVAETQQQQQQQQSVACASPGSELALLLSAPSSSVVRDLHECVAPLLFAGVKYVDPADAKEYCTSEPCKRLVLRLKRLPRCTWTATPAPDSESNDVAMARRVMADCA
ncbi:hypothetical protein P43SY_011356 [Pythium insidiosum]|uniref:Elicitin-like protein n=1 Tax=Pythium insidiosum TaxID=114742 RepID=A0AAD5M860_PYTIN|nr:hypothetical protein P43SY_011356 [Pythium insidiosum]